MPRTPPIKVPIIGEDRTARAIRSAEGNITRLGRTTRNIAGALGVGVSLSAITRLTQSAIEYGSALTDAAAATRMGVEEYQVLKFAAQEAGAGMDKVTNAAARIQKATNDARNGLTTYARAFTALNINVEEFQRLSPDRQLEQLGRAMVRSEDQAVAYASVLDIIGSRNAPRLMEVLQRLGSEGFDEVTRAARASGEIMEEFTAKRLDAAADSIESLKTKVTILAGETISWWSVLFQGGNPIEDRINAGAEAILSNMNPAMRELTELQMRYNRLQENGAGSKYLAYLRELMDAKAQDILATREQAEAQQDLNVQVGDMAKLIAAEQKYNDARRSTLQTIQSIEVEIDALQRKIEEYYRAGEGQSQAAIDAITRQTELQTKLVSLKEREATAAESAKERYIELVREHENLFKTDAEKIADLRSEIEQLNDALAGIGDKDSAEYYDKAAERMEKMIELTEKLNRKEEEAARKRDQARRDALSSLGVGASPTDTASAGGAASAGRSNHFMQGLTYSSDLASPFAAAVPTSGGGMPEGKTALQPLADAIRTDADAIPGLMEEFGGYLARILDGFEMLKQQVANSR